MQNSQRDKYLDDLLVSESEIMRLARQRAEELGRSEVPVSPYEGRLLAWLCSLANARNVLEIGTFTGYSAAWILSALPPEGQLISIEKDPLRAAETRDLLREDSRAQILNGDAERVLTELDQNFDLIFIDANKAAYVRYLEWALSHVSSGGFIVGDNTFLFGGVYGACEKDSISQKQIDVMTEFNRRLAEVPGFETLILPTYQGMTVARKVP